MHRFAPLALLAALLAALVLAAPSSAADCAPPQGQIGGTVDQARAATLLFLPGPLRTPEPVMTAQIEQLPGFSTGLISPTLGRYSPVQMLLDISQGSRVASSLYSPVVAPQPGLVAGASGSARFRQWPGLVRRAEVVPGTVVPGLLACAVEQAGRRVTWVSPAGAPTLTGIPAADARGFIARSEIVPQGRLEDALAQAQKSTDLVIGTLPSGSDGLRIARGLSTVDPARLMVIVQTPPDPARTRLLTVGVRGVGGEGGLKSATTRRNGLVAATDVAPTILERLGIAAPRQMQGRPIQGAARLSPEQLDAMNARLALVAGRRMPLAAQVIALGGLILLGLLLLGRLTGRGEEMARRVQRLVALAVLWLPFVLLACAVLRPSRATEADIAVAGSLLLALATDRLIRWPRALWLPALAVVLAHGADFLFCSGRFTGESLLGSNPLYGARFFGVGNELEAVVTVSCVLGVGAALSDSAVRRPARWFVAAGAALALFLGAGRLGADVGGVIFAGAAFGVAAMSVAGIRFTLLRAATLFGLAILGLALIAGLDALTGGQSHLTRTVVEAQSLGDLVQVAQRRFTASIAGARAGGVWVVVIAALAGLFWGWLRRDRLLSRLCGAQDDARARRPYRAGMAGALAGTLIGAVANDSGPAILIIGTVYLGMGLLYLRGRPL